MGEEAGSAYTIRAVERVCAILDLVQRSPHGFSIVDVGREAGLPKSSAFRYLATLELHGYVERDGRGRYRIGERLLGVGPIGPDLLLERARPHMEVLRDLYRETVNLCILDGNRVTYLEIVESPRTMRLAARRGDRDPLHSTAVGKAIATVVPESQLLAILEAEGMPARTPATITDPQAFLAEVDVTRRRGYAVDDGENEAGGRCVAVVVPGVGVPAALSLSAPAAQLSPEAVGSVARSLTEVASVLGPQSQEQAP